MKKLLPWLKGNWAIVALAVVALAALPAGWIFASNMNKGIVETFQKRVTTDFQDVTNARVSYELISPTGERILTTSADANSRRTEAYRLIGEKLQSQTSVVAKSAIEHNTNGGKHQPLISGLFPAPSDLEKLSKPKDFARALLESERPRLLSLVNAGTPPPADELAAALNAHAQQVRDQVKQTQGLDQLDSQQLETLAKELLAMRIGRYQSRASEICVYADASIFDEVPADAVDKTAPLAQVWDWQERTWIAEDVLRAIAAVNGSGRGVPSSVVKRIIRLSVDPAPFTISSSDGGVHIAPFEPGSDRAPTDFTRSITGRFSGPGSNNKWYDVRNVTLEIVADARRLPMLFDALASTNFMTVVDVDLQRVEPAADLREGYFYGDGPLVRATLVIETIWFREWREPWMPIDVKRALGMDKDAPVTDTPAAPRGRGGGRAPSPPAGGGGGRRGRGLEGGD